MYGFTTLLTSALALGAAANPLANKLTKKWWGNGHWHGCMSDEQASTVANNFRDTIALPFNVAEVKQTFAKDFTDYSDSVIELINSGCPNGPVALGSPTFNSRAAFIKGQSGQQPIPFTILNMWHTCDTVIIRWVSQPGPGFVQPEEQVTGIIVLETTPGTTDAEPYLIQTVYSEFNSGAWLYDIGNFTPSCAADKMVKRTVDLPVIL